MSQPLTTSQDALKDVVSDELGEHTWQFPPDTIAQMLSTKSRKSPLASAEIDTLAAYDCDIDALSQALDVARQSFVPEPWPANLVGERPHYTHIEGYLNGCVRSCHDALDSCNFKVKKGKRWYSDLNFITYDKETGDGIDGASPLKPDLSGGKGLPNGIKLYWSPSDGSPPILLPVKVKRVWKDLVIQAATYARALFSASPSRQFALVLGVEHARKELRFMIFHRGGLTASTALSMEGSDDRDTLRLFMAILTWKSAEDAGFAEWCNDVEFCLPRHKEDNNGVVARVDEVLNDSICVRGRATRVSRVSYPMNTISPPTVEPESAIVPAFTPTTRLRRSARVKGQQKDGEADKKVRSSSKLIGGTAPLAPTKRESTEEVAQKPNKEAAQQPTEAPRPIRIVGRRGREVKFVAKHRNIRFKVDMASDPTQSPTPEKRAGAVVKISWPTDNTRGIEANILEKCSGKFGVPFHHCSFQACYSSGQLMSNHLFLPPEESDLEGVHWKVFVSAGTAAPSPEYRSLWVHVSTLVGKSLACAKTPWELFQSVAHAMLGWLSMLQSGYLHRDISIGNILMVDEAVRMPEFAITQSDDLVDVFKRMSLADAAKGSNVKKDLTGLLEDLNISDKCLGFTIDVDMAALLKTMFSKAHDGERSGTREFMSRPLLKSIKFSKPYLQSPVDDLCSFYYVGQWAAVFNLSNSGQALSQEFQALRNDVAGQAGLRDDASGDIGKLSGRDMQLYPPFLVHCAPVFQKWYASIDKIITDWHDTVFADTLATEQGYDYYMPRFRAFAIRGVKEYLEILKEHRSHLMDYPVDKSDT